MYRQWCQSKSFANVRKLIFIDNDNKEKAEQNRGHAYRNLKYIGGLNIEPEDMLLIHDFHQKQSGLEDEMYDTNNIIITWSMFTENHFGSYDQLCEFMVMAGLQEIKGKIYIDTATYLADTLERAIEHYNQAVYIIRCIENNFIIHYNEHVSKFQRLRFDVNANNFLMYEAIDLNSLIDINAS